MFLGGSSSHPLRSHFWHKRFARSFSSQSALRGVAPGYSELPQGTLDGMDAARRRRADQPGSQGGRRVESAIPRSTGSLGGRPVESATQRSMARPRSEIGAFVSHTHQVAALPRRDRCSPASRVGDADPEARAVGLVMQSALHCPGGRDTQDNLNGAARAYILASNIAAAAPPIGLRSTIAKAYGDEGVIPTTPDLSLLPPRPDSTLIFAGFPPLRN